MSSSNNITTASPSSKRRSNYSGKTIDDFSPPPLPSPVVPDFTTLGNQPTQATYQSLIEGRRQIESGEAGEARLRNALQEYPDIARAMYSVLLESRKIVSSSSSSGQMSIVEPPPMKMNSVQLPVGFKSWLQPKQSQVNQD